MATIGVIACPLFFGKTVEQALAVNVENKGIVIISGHDNCDSTITIFRKAFGESYVDVAVGKSVTLK